MLKTLLRVRMAALLAAFTGQSRKRKSQTKGKAAGYAFLMLYCFCAFVFLFYASFSQLAAAFFPAGLGWLFQVEMWERFSFYGIRPLLILFMAATVYDGGMGLARENASAIVGIFAGTMYLAALPPTARSDGDRAGLDGDGGVLAVTPHVKAGAGHTHLRAACIAARSRSRLRLDFSTDTLVTLPLASTSMTRITVPWICARRAAGG